MEEWLRQNGGAPAVLILGISIAALSWPIGAAIIAAGLFLWLNNWTHFPWKVVRKFNLSLTVSDVVFTTTDDGRGRIQLLGAIINKGGAATILHSWGLNLRLPDRTEQGFHLPDAEPINTERPSLSDETSIVPLKPGTLRGFVTFGFMRLGGEDLPTAEASGVLVLSATDQSGTTWSFEQEIAPLVAVGREKS